MFRKSEFYNMNHEARKRSLKYTSLSEDAKFKITKNDHHFRLQEDLINHCHKSSLSVQERNNQLIIQGKKVVFLNSNLIPSNYNKKKNTLFVNKENIIFNEFNDLDKLFRL